MASRWMYVSPMRTFPSGFPSGQRKRAARKLGSASCLAGQGSCFSSQQIYRPSRPPPPEIMTPFPDHVELNNCSPVISALLIIYWEAREEKRTGMGTMEAEFIRFFCKLGYRICSNGPKSRAPRDVLRCILALSFQHPIAQQC